MRAHLVAFVVSFSVFGAVGCLDFTGAPCTISEACPTGQSCVAGLCRVGGAANTGGSSGTGGGSLSTGGGGGGAGRAKECEPCTAQTDCASGLSCSQRECDGASACFSNNGSCASIAGVACPKVLNFRACTSATDCGPKSACQFGRCLQQCSTSKECYIPSADLKSDVPGACVTYNGDSRCYPACTMATDLVCGPFGSYCEQFASKTFGYCELGCGGCNTTADCAADHLCQRRLCDAVKGCYPTDGGICPSIAIDNCPTSWNFATCTAKTDCGSVSDCLTVGTTARCLQLCTANADCIAVKVGSTTYPTACRPGLAGGASACVPTCVSASPNCPTGTTCVAATDGKTYCQ